MILTGAFEMLIVSPLLATSAATVVTATALLSSEYTPAASTALTVKLYDVPAVRPLIVAL
ncbi:hypothetical protein D3C86_2182440 [compost metagenome]